MTTDRLGVVGKCLRLVVGIGLTAMLTGCLVPGNGPLRSEIVETSANKGVTAYAERKMIFDLVKVDSEVAYVASQRSLTAFESTFGIGNGMVNPVLGVGDTVAVTIFEAGPDGLFSTAESKATTVTVTVQPNGRVSLPYVGSIAFAGRTLESARAAVAAGLEGRAVEPDVIINLTENDSRNVTVLGSVGAPSQVPLSVRAERINEVIARAGGLSVSPYDARVTLIRGNTTRTIGADVLLSNPSENIFIQSGDQIVVNAAPRRFTVLGSSGISARIPFETQTVNLVEAAALAGGAQPYITDVDGYFVFRYEDPAVVAGLIGKQRVSELLAAGMKPDIEGRYPIAYQFDLSDPSSYLVGQKFLMQSGDVLYVARDRVSDFTRFVALLSSTTAVTRSVATLPNTLQ